MNKITVVTWADISKSLAMIGGADALPGLLSTVMSMTGGEPPTEFAAWLDGMVEKKTPFSMSFTSDGVEWRLEVK